MSDFNILTVTYGTVHTQGMQDLIDSLVKYNWAFEIGGVNEIWRGFVSKLQFVSENCAKWKRLGYTHINFVDAFDVICTNTPLYVEQHYKRLGSPKMLLAMETGCWPDNSLRELHPLSPYPWRFYHSQYILDLRYPEILEPDSYTPTTDDQNHLMCLALKNKEIVGDKECAVWQALAHLDERGRWFEKKDGKWHNILTCTTPCFWHGNGKVNTDAYKGT